LPNPNAINPLTGKRYGWEAEQAARKQQDPRELQKQIDLLERMAMAKRAQDDFLTFVKFTMPDAEDANDITRSKYKAARHHIGIANAVEQVERGDIRFLILVCPPRHGKSELVSRRLPAWFAGRHPEQNVVVATYNDDFAADFGKDVRNIMASPQYKQVFPDVKLQRGGGASDRQQTTKGGQLSFVGRRGSLTGRGAHIMILDDLIKDDNEARSQTIRDEAWNFVTKVAMTRRMGKKLVIMTFTRWNKDDPIGRLTDPENQHYKAALAKKIKIIHLPAIAEDDDPLGRAPGEPLWPDGPDQFDLDFLEEQRLLDPLGFEALYQGNPSLLDGDIFKRENIRYYKPDELPENLRYYCSSDHAVATKQRNDPTVLLKVGIDQYSNIYLIDCFWQRVKSDAAVEAMLAMASGDRAPLIWWAEKGHISQSIGPFLNKRMLETEIFINIREVTPAADKAQRAQSIAARVGMGKVHFPNDATWTEKAVNQLMAFSGDGSGHDDFVDALAYIGLGLQSQFGASPPSPKQAEPKFGTAAWLKYMDEHKAKQRQPAGTHGGF
jgi:predicted phage terminase large subunit-like protein